MEFGLIAATAADWPIVGQIAWVFGKLMDAIYNFLNLFGIQNIGICIILFTIITVSYTHLDVYKRQDILCRSEITPDR